MRIFDTFIFFNELDLLECRLRELEDLPIQHILVESAVTLQGNPKPLYYRENQERFAPWKDRIKTVVVGDAPMLQLQNSWQRQAYQRECIFIGLKALDAELDDLIIFSDVDEIPRASVLRQDMETPRALSLKHHLFAVDWLHPYPITAPVAVRLKDVGHFDSLRIRKNGWRTRKNGWRQIPDAGWHFSWLGGPNAIKLKAAAYAHTELTDLIQRWADEGRLYQSGHAWSSDGSILDIQMVAVEVDETYPRWMQEGKFPPSWYRPRARRGPTST